MGQLTLAAAGGAILTLPMAHARAQEAVPAPLPATPAAAPDTVAETPAVTPAEPVAEEPAADTTPVAPALQYDVRVNAPGDLDELLEKNLDLERFRGNPRMDREQLQRLVRDAPEQVKELVATAGFYTPVVTVNVDTAGSRPVVTVNVEPGEPVVVDKVELELRGFDPTPPLAASEPYDTEGLKRRWALKTGAIFRQSEWESAKRALLREVVQTRYPRAQLVDTQAVVDPETHKASLLVILSSGPELRFGELRIEGLKRYDPAHHPQPEQDRPRRLLQRIGAAAVPGAPAGHRLLCQRGSERRHEQHPRRADRGGPGGAGRRKRGNRAGQPRPRAATAAGGARDGKQAAERQRRYRFQYQYGEPRPAQLRQPECLGHALQERA